MEVGANPRRHIEFSYMTPTHSEVLGCAFVAALGCSWLHATLLLPDAHTSAAASAATSTAASSAGATATSSLTSLTLLGVLAQKRKGLRGVDATWQLCA